MKKKLTSLKVFVHITHCIAKYPAFLDLLALCSKMQIFSYYLTIFVLCVWLVCMFAWGNGFYSSKQCIHSNAMFKKNIPCCIRKVHCLLMKLKCQLCCSAWRWIFKRWQICFVSITKLCYFWIADHSGGQKGNVFIFSCWFNPYCLRLICSCCYIMYSLKVNVETMLRVHIYL